MDDGAVKTLFLPYENGDLPLPAQGARILFLNAAEPPVSNHKWQGSLECVQGFRAGFLALQRAGYQVVPERSAEQFSEALVLLGKHRELNRANIYAALEQTVPGGRVLAAGAKTSGIQAMRKELAELVPIEQALSKNHAQVFWSLRPESWVPPSVTAQEKIVADGLRFTTAPGMFSHKAADAGSQMLGRHLGDVEGKAADFGAGWGYLSAMILKTAPRVTALDLFEADHSSLEAAKANLGALGSETATRFYWLDLLTEPVAAAYDAVIMNPPFHAGRSADAAIGQRMINAAAKALVPGGRLLMVANRELAYEDTIQRAFRRFERIDEDRLYKVIRAVK